MYYSFKKVNLEEKACLNEEKAKGNENIKKWDGLGAPGWLRAARLRVPHFFNVYLCLTQIETEHEWGRGRERETQNLKQAPGSELSAQSQTLGLNSQTERS